MGEEESGGGGGGGVVDLPVDGVLVPFVDVRHPRGPRHHRMVGRVICIRVVHG